MCVCAVVVFPLSRNRIRPTTAVTSAPLVFLVLYNTRKKGGDGLATALLRLLLLSKLECN